MGRWLTTASLFCLSLCLLAPATAGLAQAPTGTIAGAITDQSGAVIPNAKVTVRNLETGLPRSALTEAAGTYSVPSLPAGTYEVKVEVAGFKVRVRNATVMTGSTTTVDFLMEVGAPREVVMVQDATPQIQTESHKVDGVISRQQIEALPLNGRSFLQLALLEPGVTVSTQTLAQYNAQFGVSILGGENTRTSISADGGNIRDRTTGNTAQNFSQEVVQEFQLSAVNFDLSTGITSVGSVNIVTRSGGNTLHGNSYFFFRDHNLAGYPALRRNALNPDPFFARRQSGFWLGGPIKRDRAFFFFNLEHNNQDGVVTVQPTAASLASFWQIAATPYTAKQISNRFDFALTPRHTLFLRYSHDGNRGFGPIGAANMPSNWLVNANWADQSILGFTSVFRPNLVNDFRFQYAYWNNRNLFPARSDCPGCVGFDFPEVTIAGTNFVMGHTFNATQGRDYRTFQWSDNLTWDKGAHRMRLGGEWEMDITKGFWGRCDPACITVYSAETSRARAPGIALPSSFRTIEDLLELPVQTLVVGYGDPRSPAPYQFGRATTNHRLRAFWQDSWRLHPRFTLNYGAAWQAETTLANHDLDKPAFLAPILGGGDNLRPPRRDWNNVSPSLGLAWNVNRDNRTVVRAGAGVYYDTQLLWQRLNERPLLGPYPNGRIDVPGGRILNTIPGIPGVPLGRPLDFASLPTEFRLRHFMAIIPQLGAILGPGVGSASNDLSVRGIHVVKSATGLATFFPRDYPAMYAVHLNAGVQRELGRNLVLSADFVSRRFLKELITATGPDYNHWNRPEALGGPVIPACTGTQAADPRAQCSAGPIQVRTPGGRSNYKALLLKLDKRFTTRYQFTASYALQARTGINGVINKKDWFASWGPQGARHLFNVSGVVNLPWNFQVSLISTMSGRTPVMPTIVNIDLDGDGTASEPLPGAQFNGFNRGLDKADLARLVNDFNQNLAGRTTPRNQRVPVLSLPAQYEFGDNFSSQDLRLTKMFRMKERYRVQIFGEVFNVFNFANLAGFSFNLNDPTSFGKPTQRSTQVFGTGGPRAFQLGARFSF